MGLAALPSLPLKRFFQQQIQAAFVVGKQAVEVAVLLAPLVVEFGGDAFYVPVAFPEREIGGVDFVLVFAVKADGASELVVVLVAAARSGCADAAGYAFAPFVHPADAVAV